MTSTPDPIAAIERALEGAKKEADRQYCWSLDQFQKTPCLGAEYKMNNGLFGTVEHKAHESANRAMGRHFGAYDAIRLIEPAIISLLSLARKASSAEARVSELEMAIGAFLPLAQLAFLWQTKGAKGDEVERYRSAYHDLRRALSLTQENSDDRNG